MAAARVWRMRIKKAAQEAGTYRPYFDQVIATLADILERKDGAVELFQKSGGKVVVAHTNKAGATNLEKNPCLKVIEDCEAQALAYWRDLGLTPAGLKRINEESLKNGGGVAEKVSFSSLLESLTG